MPSKSLQASVVASCVTAGFSVMPETLGAIFDLDWADSDATKEEEKDKKSPFKFMKGRVTFEYQEVLVPMDNAKVGVMTRPQLPKASKAKDAKDKSPKPTDPLDDIAPSLQTTHAGEPAEFILYGGDVNGFGSVIRTG